MEREIRQVIIHGSSGDFVSQFAGKVDDAEHEGGTAEWSVQLSESGSHHIRFLGSTSANLATVRGLPNQRARATASADKHDDAFWIAWDQRLVEMKNDGWKFDGSGAASKLGVGAKPGRPRLEANVWGHEQLHELDRPEDEVYEGWLDMRGPEEIAHLDNPYKSFKKAMKPR